MASSDRESNIAQEPAERLGIREEQRLLTQRRILESALQVFDEKGYYASTVEDIVAAGGIARGTFYLHFKNKLQLVQSLTAELGPEVANLYHELDELVTSRSGDSRAAIRDWMSRTLSWFVEHRTIALVWQEISVSEPELEAEPSFWVAERMHRYLDQWPADQREAARLRIVLLIQQLARAFLLSYVRGAIRVDNDLLVSVLSDLWADSLRPPTRTASPRGNARSGR
jgi:AcrR family transcriptional regulator